jgi:hypothetical protein
MNVTHQYGTRSREENALCEWMIFDRIDASSMASELMRLDRWLRNTL